MIAEREHSYASFVVRLWHERATGRLLRIEIEHVQTGLVSRAAGVDPAWILDEIRRRLDRLSELEADPQLESGAAATGQRRPPDVG